MASITQDMRCRLSLINFAAKYGVSMVMVDVKFVPPSCLAGDAVIKKLYATFKY